MHNAAKSNEFNKSVDHLSFSFAYLAPRYWLVWLWIGALRSLVALPQPMRMAAGRAIGRLLLKFAGKRRRIAERNLHLCFPEADAKWVSDITRANFESMGEALIETGMCWWLAEPKLIALTDIKGLEHLQAALDKGKGVILLSAHFTSLELGVRLLDPFTEATIYPVYQRHKNPLMEYIITGNRLKHAKGVFSNDNVRGMIRALRNNGVLWYAPDQNYRGQFSAMVDFFGHAAPSNTATSKLAQVSGAAVLPYIIQRRADGLGYCVEIGAALDNFPGESAEVDTRRYHEIIEQAIRITPEQYLWTHKRFKRRPKDFEDVYAGI
ncbi:MAG: LpxL/LpxP family Kdo(2)-lipid IV(A) lauroyl/palmitoleoyl acyltransferase [Gammaproteobacteria bacterium]|nr:LpxL/LpxP family Kdo(2)-lipid IV(A) lauroyl/palmitoleoyl acyltransferase [Gammaproteobacteria bacterium]